MRFKKTLTSFILICISILCFFGCAEVESFRMITYDQYGNGIIVDRLVITLDKKELGLSYESVKNSIQDDMLLFRNYVNDWIESFDEDYTEEYLELVESISCEVSALDNILSLTITFTGAESFAMFYGIVDIEEGVSSKAMDDVGQFLSKILKQEYKTEEIGWFLYKYNVVSNTSLVDLIPDFKVDQIGTNYYKKYSNLTGFDLEDINVSQVFVYPTDSFVYVNDHIHHNADVVEEVDNHTFLAWDLSDKEEDFEISLFKLAPKPVAWYVLGFIISVIFIIVTIVIIKSKQKKSIWVKITKAEAEKDEQ